MGKRHTLSEAQFAYLMELWNKYHNTVHIRTIELTEEEAALYEGAGASRRSMTQKRSFQLNWQNT